MSTNQSWSKKAASVSGVAEIDNVGPSSTSIQISCVPVSGSSVVTITVKPALVDSYQSVQDGEIDLASPTTLVVAGRIDAVKATAANSGDSFDLVVVA